MTARATGTVAGRTASNRLTSAAESVAGLAPIPAPPLRVRAGNRTWDPVRFTGPERSAEEPGPVEKSTEGTDSDRPDTARLPDPASWAATLVRAAVEVLKGRRPAAQLVRWFEADLWAVLARRAQIGVQAAPGTARPAPVRVRRVHGCPITDGIWEGSVILNDGERTRAVALRLEVLRGRWCATALTIG